MATRKTTKKIEEAVETVKETVKEVSDNIVGVVANCLHLNVREKPNIEASILDVLPALTEVKIDEKKSTKDFYAIVYGKIKGFCMKKYIEIK